MFGYLFIQKYDFYWEGHAHLQLAKMIVSDILLVQYMYTK